MHLAQEVLIIIQCGGGTRSFEKDTRALKMRHSVAGHRKLATINWEQSSNLIFLQTTGGVAEELNVGHFKVIWPLKKIRKVKNLNKWVPQELTANQKNHHFEMSSFLILCNNTEQLLDQIVTCNEMWILYNNQKWPAQWLDWEEIPKHFPKSDLQQKMFMVTVCWSVAHQIHYNFLKPGETITTEKCAQSISEMHQKTSTSAASINQKKGPSFSPCQCLTDHTLHSQCFNSEWIAMTFCFIFHTYLTSCQPTTTSSSISKLFARKMLPQPAGGRK